VDGAGILYIVDSGNNTIRRVISDGSITTIAGNGTPGYSGDNGPATSAQLDQPSGIAVDASGNIYIADALNDVIRLLQPAPAQ
jgi:sugar lactone lactonase YvrE